MVINIHCIQCKTDVADFDGEIAELDPISEDNLIQYGEVYGVCEDCSPDGKPYPVQRII